MKQLVFRIFDPKVPIIQVILGNVIDGEFKPETDDLPAKHRSLFGAAADYIRYDEYFGGTPFIISCDFSSLFSAIFPVENIEFLPGFLVLTLNPDKYVTPEEKK